jgi:hypothetical protein
LRQEAHREVPNTDVGGRGSIVVSGFGRRTAICLRGARRRLYRECSSLCGTGSRIRDARLRGTGLWGSGSNVRTNGFCRTGACIWSTGLCAPGTRLHGSCVLRGCRANTRRTTSLRRARPSLPIRLCGRIRAEATRRGTLSRRRSLHRQSRLRSVGILQLRRRPSDSLDHNPFPVC